MTDPTPNPDSVNPQDANTQNVSQQDANTQNVNTQDGESIAHTDTVAQTDHDAPTDTLSSTDNTPTDNTNKQGTENQEDSDDTAHESTTESDTDTQTHNLRTDVNFGDDADAEDVDSFISLSQQLGLNAEQAQTAWDTLQQAQAEQAQAETAQAKVYEGQLRQMWGNAYDNNYASAQQGILSAGGDDLRNILTHAGIVNHPVVMQAFATIGQSHLEQGTVPSHHNGVHNPFHSDTYNLTEQMRLYRENPSLAAMLEKAASSS